MKFNKKHAGSALSITLLLSAPLAQAGWGDWTSQIASAAAKAGSYVGITQAAPAATEVVVDAASNAASAATEVVADVASDVVSESANQATGFLAHAGAELARYRNVAAQAAAPYVATATTGLQNVSEFVSRNAANAGNVVLNNVSAYSPVVGQFLANNGGELAIAGAGFATIAALVYRNHRAISARNALAAAPSVAPAASPSSAAAAAAVMPSAEQLAADSSSSSAASPAKNDESNASFSDQTASTVAEILTTSEAPASSSAARKAAKTVRFAVENPIKLDLGHGKLVSSANLLAQVKENQRHNVTEIVLYHNNLQVVSDELIDALTQFPNLKTLLLGTNGLTTVPARLISELPNLKILGLAQNNIETLPEEIVNANLDAINITRNPIASQNVTFKARKVVKK